MEEKRLFHSGHFKPQGHVQRRYELNAVSSSLDNFNLEEFMKQPGGWRLRDLPHVAHVINNSVNM